MSDFLVYLPLEPYLREWFIHEQGGSVPVQLQRGSPESNILEYCLKPQPRDAVPGQDADPECLPVYIPYFKARDPRTYNYLPLSGRKMLRHTISNRFRIQLWEELHRLENVGTPLTDLVYLFLERHGIEPTERNWCAVSKIYYRLRGRYRTNTLHKKLS